MKQWIAPFVCLSLLCAFSSELFGQSTKRTTAEVRTTEATSQNLLVQGYDAYSKGDWTTALFFFRKAVSIPEQSNEETWFMLIMSEMYAGEYEKVSSDGTSFCNWYPNSEYKPNVQYQMGRAKHLLNDNDQAVLLLSEFCHHYPTNELYPSALFWIAECFYEDYNFTVAKALYERIVSDYYNNAKAVDAQYRIETISQREREEKLLYLLKVTGEEYLAAKEEYEKQLKEYQTEELMGLRKQVKDLSASTKELKASLEEAERYTKQLENQLAAMEDKNVQDRLAAENAKITEVPAENTTTVIETVSQEIQTPPASQTSPVSQTPPVTQPIQNTDTSVTSPVNNQPVINPAPVVQTAPVVEPNKEIEALKLKAKELQQLYDKQKATQPVVTQPDTTAIEATESEGENR